MSRAGQGCGPTTRFVAATTVFCLWYSSTLRLLTDQMSVAVRGLHLYGFPSGLIGMAMVFVWGIALGILRVRSGGMLVPIVTHIAADLVIFTILAMQAAGLS